MPSLTATIKPTSELHKRILTSVEDRVRFSKRKFLGRHKLWRKNEEAALAFLKERDVDATKRLEREGGKPQYTTLVIPYSYGVLMASHTYWTTVFMARTPVFQFQGRHGEGEQATQALEALIDYQRGVGKMLVPLYIWLMDVGKYGVGVTGLYWRDEIRTVSNIEEVEIKLAGVIGTGRFKKKKITEKVRGYSGNVVYNVRPYDFLPDPRVPINRFQEGEFCAVYNELGWNVVLERAAAGYYTNIDLLEKEIDRGGSGSREEGSSAIELPDSTGLGPSLFEKKSEDVVKTYECAIRVIPKDWGLGNGTVQEKWIFTVTADFKYVIGAQPLGAYHDQFPYNVIEYETEGYGLANRGIPEVLDPVQRTLDWLINSHFYNVRKALNDQFIVDPSRVMMSDVQDPLPGGIIRLKPEAYGSDPKTAMVQLDVVDVTQNHLRDMDMMIRFGERASGVNDSIQGLQSQGGRKTAQEIRTSTSFGINRLKTEAEYMAAMGWSPMAQMMVQNSQQYYSGEQKFRIVGDLAQEAGQQFVDVTPDSIAGFFDWVPVDGTLPVDRFAQANLWRTLLADIVKVPQIAQSYDIGRIFAWVAQLSGLKNINQFRIELQPDDVVAQQAQAGNLIGGGGVPAKGLPDIDTIPAKQVGTGKIA